MLNFLRNCWSGSGRLQDVPIYIVSSIPEVLSSQRKHGRRQFVNSYFLHGHLLSTAPKVLCPDIYRIIVTDLVNFFMSYFGRSFAYRSIEISFSNGCDLGLTEFDSIDRRGPHVYRSFHAQYSCVDFIDTTVHELETDICKRTTERNSYAYSEPS